MLTCPLCGHENLDGVDVCDRCESSLYELSTPQPQSSEERHILKDRLYVLSPRRAITVAAETPIQEVLDTMIRHGVGCVLIAREDELQGIFTERDALLRIDAEDPAFRNQPISTVMTSNPHTLEITDRIAFALHKMDVGGYRHIPILTDGRLTGMISLRDVLKYISRHLLAMPV